MGSKAQMANCGQCQADVSADDNFCHQCGAVLISGDQAINTRSAFRSSFLESPLLRSLDERSNESAEYTKKFQHAAISIIIVLMLAAGTLWLVNIGRVLLTHSKVEPKGEQQKPLARLSPTINEVAARPLSQIKPSAPAQAVKEPGQSLTKLDKSETKLVARQTQNRIQNIDRKEKFVASPMMTAETPPHLISTTNGMSTTSKSNFSDKDKDIANYNKLLANFFSIPNNVASKEPPTFADWLKGGKQEF